MVLPPASSPIEATAAKQKNDDDDDEKRGHVHDLPAPKAILIAGETMHRLFLQKVFQGILEPAGYVVNFAGRIFVPALDQT
jgi:hypothetical protein